MKINCRAPVRCSKELIGHLLLSELIEILIAQGVG